MQGLTPAPARLLMLVARIEPIQRMLRPMRVARTCLMVCSLLLLPLAACHDGSAGSAGSDRPYKVAFTNDTAEAVVVLGCSDCADGHQLAAGASWTTRLAGGDTEVSFDRAGVQVGCVHFANGVIPDKDDPASIVNISEYIPCRK